MRFDDLDIHMRQFETSHDHCVLPGIHIVARMDGRSFTKLTKETLDFAKPFDVRMRDHMEFTAAHLMQCGFESVYGYAQSDEISILFKRNIDTFGRKKRKYESVLAGEASAKFTALAMEHGVFDARLCLLPRDSDVVDYFRWRQEDAHRNALSAHCYWMLRGKGLSARAASRELEGKGVAAKNELLFQHGMNFNDRPAWEKRGIGLYFKQVPHTGVDPRTGTEVPTTRRALYVNHELPIGDEYASFVERRIQEANA
jgi:tRNA(His) guanylyltransferase